MNDEVIPLEKLGKRGTVRVYTQSYVEQLKKENTELKNQIEKMKCCENCKHHCFLGGELKCMVLPYEEELKCMKTKEYWEIKENEETK